MKRLCNDVQPCRPMDSDRVVGVAELAKLFGVNRSTVNKWEFRRRKTGFPLPVKRLQMGSVYDQDEVIAWYVRWKGLSTFVVTAELTQEVNIALGVRTRVPSGIT